MKGSTVSLSAVNFSKVSISFCYLCVIEGRHAVKWSAKWMPLGSTPTHWKDFEKKKKNQGHPQNELYHGNIFLSIKGRLQSLLPQKISLKKKKKGMSVVHFTAESALFETWKEIRIQKHWSCWEKVSKKLLTLVKISHITNDKPCST